MTKEKSKEINITFKKGARANHFDVLRLIAKNIDNIKILILKQTDKEETESMTIEVIINKLNNKNYE